MGRRPNPPPSPAVARWLRLNTVDVHGIGEETGNLETFARFFSVYAFEKSRNSEVKRLSLLLDRLIDDLEEGIERAITANVEELRAGEEGQEQKAA